MPLTKPSQEFAFPAPASSRPALETDTRAVSFADMVASACEAGTPFRVEVWRGDRHVGEVLLCNTVVACRAGQRTGEDAFCVLAEIDAARFRVFRLKHAPREVEIATPLDELLDVARWAHRRRRIVTQPPAESAARRPATKPDTRPTPPASSDGARPAKPGTPDTRPVPIVRMPAPAASGAAPPPAFEELFRAAMVAYVERRYDEARRLLESCRALRPDDVRVSHNLRKVAAHAGPR